VSIIAYVIALPIAFALFYGFFSQKTERSFLYSVLGTLVVLLFLEVILKILLFFVALGAIIAILGFKLIILLLFGRKDDRR